MGTPEQLQRAIDYHNEMIAKYPEKNVIYFICKKTDEEYIQENLANNVFFDFCHSLNAYGEFEILRLIKDKKIPEDIIQFYLDYGDIGSTDIDAIYLFYNLKYKKEYTFPKNHYEAYLNAIDDEDYDNELDIHENDSDKRILIQDIIENNIEYAKIFLQ